MRGRARQSVDGPNSPTAGERITTVIRLRPRFAFEKSKDGELGLSVRIEPPSKVVLVDPQQSQQARTFVCDVALDSSNPELPHYADQLEVYRNVGEKVINHVTQGYNCCICAYGQTGTGKTHTLHGDWSSAEKRGLLPRTAAALLARVQTLREGGAEVRLQASCIEIYNSRLSDLLAPAEPNHAPATKKQGRLEIHTHPAIGVYVDNLSELEVHSLKDVGRLVSIAEKLRRTATTSMNQRSSRSHTLFSFKIEVRGNAPAGEESRMATVQFADLAGRENEQTSECTGERFRELTFINRSLFQLANCVHALTDGGREHVPFRNSKLTMLLSESFQRNSRTFLLATLTPSASGYEENLLTCRFLESTGRIQTQPVPNKFNAADLSAQLKDEIDLMRQQLGLTNNNPLQLGSAPAQLKSRQDLLKYLSSGSVWGSRAGAGPPQAGDPSNRELSEHDRAKSAVVADACRRVNRKIEDAVSGFERLQAAQTVVEDSLGKVEMQLSAVEAAVKELQPNSRKTNLQQRPQDSHRHRGDGQATTPRADAWRLPPLLPGQLQKEPGAGKQSVPAVTFSVELPPIVVL